MTPQRKLIFESYSKWTVLSALRSGAPIKSRADVYPLISKIKLDMVLDCQKGIITKDEFEEWHKEILKYLVGVEPKLCNQFGWAAKILNIYLKTYCYIGEGGREGIRAVLHPPVDSGLWSGVARRFKGNNKILYDSHVVTKIKEISSHDIYLRVIKGMRAASDELGCPLIEIEQLWEGAVDE